MLETHNRFIELRQKFVRQYKGERCFQKVVNNAARTYETLDHDILLAALIAHYDVFVSIYQLLIDGNLYKKGKLECIIFLGSWIRDKVNDTDKNKLRRVIRRMRRVVMKCFENIEDFEQSCFLCFFDAMQFYKPEKGGLRGFIVTVFPKVLSSYIKERLNEENPKPVGLMKGAKLYESRYEPERFLETINGMQEPGYEDYWQEVIKSGKLLEV